MKAETQAVKKRPGTQNALVPQRANHIGQRIRGIGNDQGNGLRRGRVKLRNAGIGNLLTGPIRRRRFGGQSMAL
jgi:hypothetical protein